MANPNIVELTTKNRNFRKVLSTNEHSQVVMMSVEPGDDIGEETHDVDQIIVIVAGDGQSVLDGKRAKAGPGSMVQVPAGMLHNIVNKGEEPLKLYTIYAPPEEEPDTVHKTKAEAEAADAD